ncbi:hypothetical protein ACFXTO_018789 [Malus domestica]
MMVDNGSTVNLLQLSIIQKIGLESIIIRRVEVLTRFNGHTSTAIGHITLDVKTQPVVSKKTFTIISDLFPYNGILGRHWLIKLDVVTSVKYKKSNSASREEESKKSSLTRPYVDDALCRY